MNHLLVLLTLLGTVPTKLSLYSMSNLHTYTQVEHQSAHHTPNISRHQAARVQRQLFTAIALGDSAMVKQALQNHANPNALFERTCCDKTADTAVECASWMCHDSKDCEYLIGLTTCLCYAAFIPVLFYFKHPILLLGFPTICCVGPLCYGIKHALGGLCYSCARCLTTQQQLLTLERAQNQDTPLLMACRSNTNSHAYVNIIKLLLEAGAKTHVQDIECHTPLQLALPKSFNAARLLCLAGASIYSTNEEIETILNYLSPSNQELLLNAHQAGTALHRCKQLAKEDSPLHQYLPSPITLLVVSYCLPLTKHNENPSAQFIERLIQNDSYLSHLQTSSPSEPSDSGRFSHSSDYLSLKIKNMDPPFQKNDHD